MKNQKKALTQYMDMSGLSLDVIAIINYEFFLNKDYEWFHQVEIGDVVVDLGACCGAFTAHALDRGASKVYMVEGNNELLKVAIKNVSDYLINELTPKVYPINYFIGESNPSGVYLTPNQELDVNEIGKISLLELVNLYNIEFIDYLKVDIEGNEYDVLKEEDLSFFINRVGHIAVEVHTQKFDGSVDRFFKFRDTFLKPLINHPSFSVNAASKGQNMNHFLHNTIWDDNAIRSLPVNDSYFMIYITNNS